MYPLKAYFKGPKDRGDIAVWSNMFFNLTALQGTQSSRDRYITAILSIGKEYILKTNYWIMPCPSMHRYKSYGSKWRCGNSHSEPTSQPAAGYHDAPQRDKSRVRRNANTITCHFADTLSKTLKILSSVVGISNQFCIKPAGHHLCYYKKFRIKIVSSYPF